MKPAHLVLLILMNVFWAASIVTYKALADYPYLTPGAIVTFRFGLAALCLLFLWPWLPGQAPRGRDLVRTALMGIAVSVLGHRWQVLGVKLGSAGNSAVLMAVEPLLTSVVAAIFLREHIAFRRWLGFLLGMSGVVLLNRAWEPDFRWTSLAASLIFLSSFFCEATYSVAGKPLFARAGAAKVLALALFAGTIGNLFLDGATTWQAAQQMPPAAWLGAGYLAVICTAIGYTVWSVVIRDTDVNIVALTIFVQPVAGVACAALWLGERLHWGQFWGCLVIVAGLLVGLWSPGVLTRQKFAGTECAPQTLLDKVLPK